MVLCDPNIKRVNLTCPFPLINAVTGGLQEGDIFKYEFDDFYFVLHKAGFSFLTNGTSIFYNEVFELFTKSQKVPRYFHIYEPPDEILFNCKNKKLVNTRVRKRIQLKYTSDSNLEIKVFLPQGFRLHKIDEHSFERMSVFKLELDNKFWKSKTNFINKGFGFYISDENNNPVSICYSACIIDGVAEIDIATLEGFRKIGLANALVAEFVNYCNKLKISANWDCFEENQGSLKTAESIGFQRTLEYLLLSVYRV